MNYLQFESRLGKHCTVNHTALPGRIPPARLASQFLTGFELSIVLRTTLFMLVLMNDASTVSIMLCASMYRRGSAMVFIGQPDGKQAMRLQRKRRWAIEYLNSACKAENIHKKDRAKRFIAMLNEQLEVIFWKWKAIESEQAPSL